MDSIKCVFVTPEYVNSAVEFWLDHFLTDFPLGFYAPDTPSDSPQSFFRKVLEEGTSVMAIDTENENRIVGVRGNKKVTKADFLRGRKMIESRLEEPYMRFLHLVSSRYKVEERLDVENVMLFKYMAVHRTYRGQGIGAKMVEFTLQFMRSEQIPVAYVLVVSGYAKQLFKKIGFEVVDEMDYQDYKVDGEVIFKPAAPIHKGWCTMIKWV